MLNPVAAGVVVAASVGCAGLAASTAGRRMVGSRVLVRLGARAASGSRWLRPPAFVREGLFEAGLGAIDPGRATTVWAVGTLVLGAATAAVAGALLALGAVAAASVAPVVASKLVAGRRGRLVDGQLPEFLEAVGRSLRAGATLHLAIDEASTSAAAPLGDDLASLRREVVAGAGLVDALDRWASRCPRRPVRLVVAALASSAESGGAGARAVDGVAASLRASTAVAAETRALSSQARYSALVIGIAPVGFSLLALGADPRTAQFLLETPLGRGCLAGGLALDGVGAWWMHRIATAVS